MIQRFDKRQKPSVRALIRQKEISCRQFLKISFNLTVLYGYFESHCVLFLILNKKMQNFIDLHNSSDFHCWPVRRELKHQGRTMKEASSYWM
jgi:hypothetical protein